MEKQVYNKSRPICCLWQTILCSLILFFSEELLLSHPFSQAAWWLVLTCENCSSLALLFNPTVLFPWQGVRRFENKAVDVVTFLKVSLSLSQLFLLEIRLDKCDLYIGKLRVQVFLVHLLREKGWVLQYNTTYQSYKTCKTKTFLNIKR